MLTAKETANLIDQINKSFEQDRKEIEKLKERVKALEIAEKTPKAAKKGAADDK